jgi:hypothetical protein
MELRNVTRIPMAALPGLAWRWTASTARRQALRFGLACDELPGFLSERGFRLESELGPHDLAHLYLTDGAGQIHGGPSGWLGFCLTRVHPSAPRVLGAPR